MKARENPFRSECVERLRFRAEGFSWDHLEAGLAAAGGRGAIVGPEGHGKTTLLLEWFARLRAAGQRTAWLRIRRGAGRLDPAEKRTLAGAEAVFADSVEQLGWLGWREFVRVVRPAATVVVTTHRPGRFAPVFFCRTSPELLGDLVDELGGTEADVRALWQRHRGNIRGALRELYDVCGLQKPGPVQGLTDAAGPIERRGIDLAGAGLGLGA